MAAAKLPRLLTPLTVTVTMPWSSSPARIPASSIRRFVILGAIYNAQLVCVHLERDAGRLIESDILLLVPPVIEDFHCQIDAQFVVGIFGSAVEGTVCGVLVIAFCVFVRFGVDPGHVGILPGFLWEGDRGHAVSSRYGRLAVGTQVTHCLGCRVGDGHFE